MAQAVHLFRVVGASQGSTSATPVEISPYTITWAQLQAAGFAAGDEVLILCRMAIGGEQSTPLRSYDIGRGTTFAGRTVYPDSAVTYESNSNSSSTEMQFGAYYTWVARVTLAANENLYWSLTSDGSTLAAASDFSCFILKTTGLPSDAIQYAEQTHSGNAPTAYDTSGAAITIPGSRSGDWLILALSRWLVDSTNTDHLMALQYDGVDYGEVSMEGEDTNEERLMLTARYVAGVTGNVTARVRFRNESANQHDCVLTRIIAIDLKILQNYVGAQTTNTITHSSVDVFQEVAGAGSFNHGTTGGLFVFCHLTYGGVSTGNRSPYGRIQIGGSDWTEAGLFRDGGSRPHAPSDLVPYTIFAGKSETSGTKDIDVDAAEDVAVGTGYSTSYQTFVAFGLELAAAAPRRARVSATEIEVPAVPRRVRISAVEVEVPIAPRRARVSAVEIEVPTAPRRARVSATEFEAPGGPRRARISATEFEVPNAARRARLSAAEIEVPIAPRRARVSATEIEVPIAPRRARVSALEVEVPGGPRRAQITAAEIEVPSAARRARLSAAEVEVPTAPRRARISATEFEVPGGPRRARVSAVEVEVPTAPRRARVSASEIEVPTPPRRADISAVEFEVPTAPRRARVSALEVELPHAPRRSRISAAELEVPAADRAVRVTAAETEVPHAPRRGRLSATEFEVPTLARAVRVAAVEFEVPQADRRARVTAGEFEVPMPPRRVRITAAEFEVPTFSRTARISAVVFDVPSLGKRVSGGFIRRRRRMMH